jgi:RNA-directed DNA polymerase
MPMKNKHVLKQWIKAGVIENGNFQPLNIGVPQGGSISPTIFNIVMNGVEDEILKVSGTFPIRYADDLIIAAFKPEDLEKAKELLIEFLKPRGLEINGEKTVMVPIAEGVDFLGYNIREYPDRTRVGKKRKPNKQGILLIKPSPTAVKNFRNNIKKTLSKFNKVSAGRLIQKLNPIIRG